MRTSHTRESPPDATLATLSPPFPDSPAPGGSRDRRPRRQPVVVLTTTPSDSHTWNLVFLGLLLTECGCRVVSVGPCPPVRLVVDICVRDAPDLIVVSSVNGHGAEDGVLLARRLRAAPQLRTTPMVIGGKLGIEGRPVETGRLEEAGFTRVLSEDAESLSRLVAAVKAGTAL